jgi:hypothetical protein
MAKFTWIEGKTEKVGTSDEPPEVSGIVNNPSSVIVGVGARVNGDKFTTLALWVAPILDDGTIGASEKQQFGSDPSHELEAQGSVGCQEVVVGVGFGVKADSVDTLKLWARRLDASTGKLGDLKEYGFGTNAYDTPEVYWYCEDSAPVSTMNLITGVGVGVKDNTADRLILNTGNLTN